MKDTATAVEGRKPLGVVVTGATGWLGERLASQLFAEAIPVIAVGRSARPGPWQCFHEADITRAGFGDGLSEMLGAARAWAIVHCAGLAHRPLETPSVCRLMHEINAEGTRRVVDLCGTLGITRFVYASSISVYDWSSRAGDAPRTEESGVAPSSAYAASKLGGEDAVRASGLDWTIVRLATIFGEGDRANFAKLAQSLRRRVFVLPGAGTARKSVISVDDAARCLSALATSSLASRQTLNLAYVEAPTLRVICEELAAVCGVSRPASLPVSLLRCVARCGDMAQALNLPAPLSTATLRKLTTSTEVDCGRAGRILPVLESSGFSEAMRRVGDSYRRQA